MSAATPATSRLLIISPNSGGLKDEVEAKLRDALADYRIIDFNPRRDFRRAITPGATVVVAGGDGTVGSVVRALAGSRRRLGIVPLGTFNNFAAALGLPKDVDSAIAVIRAGRTRPVTLGRINGKPFLEAAAVGMFGAAIVLGETAKDFKFGRLGRDLRALAGAKRFDYTLAGDLDGRGEALSLVFTNTPTIGARMPVGRKRPTEAYLDLAVQVGSSRTDIVSRVLAAIVSQQDAADGVMSFRFRTIRVETKPVVSAYADNEQVGRTPVLITTEPSALRAIVP